MHIKSTHMAAIPSAKLPQASSEMSSATSVLSQTLQGITTTKVAELNREREAYEEAKKRVLEAADDAGLDYRLRLARLLSGAEELLHVPRTELDTTKMKSWLGQSEYDSTVSQAVLEGFEQDIRSKLDIKSRKFKFANLYSRLLMQWLGQPDTDKVMEPQQEDSALDESLELLEKDRLQQLRDKFETVVFTPLETDEGAIGGFLADLFKDDKGKTALEGFRGEIYWFGHDFLKTKAPFEPWTLKWCIKGLINFELLKDEKKTVLQDFVSNEVVLKEIADVLNMRWRNIANWSWDAENGIPVEPRRQLNGKYRVIMDEDILQAIFTHYIGIKWSVMIKTALKKLVSNPSVWNNETRRSEVMWDRMRFYLKSKAEASNKTPNLQQLKQNTYQSTFFMSQLPDDEQMISNGYEVDDDDQQNQSDQKSWNSLKQQLLRQLAADTVMMHALDGKAAVVQSDLQWFFTSLSHTTVFAVLKFCGFSDAWITFFRKFLETPLNMKPSSSNASAMDSARIRRRGVPMAHSQGNFFAEIVLSFLDIAVKQQANVLLYRLRDDFWVWGDPQKCAKSWQIMSEFATVMGLEFNQKKTGSVYMTSNGVELDPQIHETLPKGPVSFGFLFLDEKTGIWKINQEHVDAHVNQLKKQLSECTSVFTWVRTWNSCIGRFFGHTFGQPANCFGREHVVNTLETHRRIQEKLFPDQSRANVLTHLKCMVAESFGVDDIPDAFVFLPEEFGGLGVLNPFRHVFVVRDEVIKDPQERIRKFLSDEYKEWADLKENFEAVSKSHRMRRWEAIWHAKDPFKKYQDNGSMESDVHDFMSLSEFKLFRNSDSALYKGLYDDLMDAPSASVVKLSSDIDKALGKVSSSYCFAENLDEDIRAAVKLYADELFEQFGGLSIVEKDMLPLGVMQLLRSRRVSWQMVL